MSGSLSYHAGLAAEEQVAIDYRRRGHEVVARRWRGKAGEIDLICAGSDGIVFVEVKKSRSHARAADSLRPAQIARLLTAAQEYLATCPQGLATPARFDIAVIDAVGRIRIVENALVDP